LQLVLLGAEEGLYSLSLDGPGKHAPRMLPGVERAFQMDVVSDLNLVIMIAGTRELSRNVKKVIIKNKIIK